MAEEEPKTAPVESQEAQNTTMTEATTEGPSTTTESTEVPATAEAMDTSADNTEAKENDAALAGAQATTEVNAPDGEGKTEAAVLPSDVAEAATPTGNKNGKRKSTSGVPEHKSKKLNKKKSVAQLNLNINPGDYYWARLKGYSPWPSIVCDEDMLPEILLGNRPVSAKRADGSYREDYEDDGKNAKDRTYPVMFLGTNEFSWMVNTSLTKLEPGDCTPDKQTGKMSKALKEAYDIAEERHDLNYFKNMLDDFMQQQKQAQEEQAARQAEKEAKAAKKAEKAAADKTKEKKDRRKSKSKETVSDADDMDLDVPEDAEAKPTKKRKKDADSEGEGPKPKKTPKATKVAATKTNGESAKKAAKPRKVVQKPADEEPATEAEKLERREKAVLYLRHRLQKGFLMRDQTPKEDEMSTMNDFFTQLEGYENLEPAIIRGTKIYKVLRGIIKLSSIPKEEEFQFKKRSNDLLALWHDALGSKGDEKEDEKTEDKDNGEKAEKPSEKPEEVAENTESKEPTEAPSNPEAAEDKDVAMTDVKEDKAEAAAAPAAQSETAAAE